MICGWDDKWDISMSMQVYVLVLMWVYVEKNKATKDCSFGDFFLVRLPLFPFSSLFLNRRPSQTNVACVGNLLSSPLSVSHPLKKSFVFSLLYSVHPISVFSCIGDIISSSFSFPLFRNFKLCSYYVMIGSHWHAKRGNTSAHAWFKNLT